MTHHSYLTQLDKKALKENKIVISYDRTGREKLVVGETYPFFMDSGFGSHERVVIDIAIEQRHMDNPYELIYDIINKIVSDAKVVLDWMNGDNSRWEHPAIKRLISILKQAGYYKNNITELREDRKEYIEEIISDVSVKSYGDAIHSHLDPDLSYYGICIEEFRCMNRDFKDIDYISECQGILVILLGRNKVGVRFNTENVDWYGMDFNGLSFRPKIKISEKTGHKVRVKRELNLAKELAVVLRSEKGWEDVVRHYLEVIRKADVERATWIQDILDKALRINKRFHKDDCEISKFINSDFIKTLSAKQLENLSKKTIKPYIRGDHTPSVFGPEYYITFLPGFDQARTELFLSVHSCGTKVNNKFTDRDIMRWMKDVHLKLMNYPEFQSDFSKLEFVIYDANMNIIGGNLIYDYNNKCHLD